MINADDTPGPAGRELLGVATYLIAFVVLATIVVSHGRQHADAVMDADPAINIVLGRGSMSFVHPHVVPGTPNPDLAPTYTRALAAWLALGGISCRTVMSMNVVLVACTTFCLWLFVARAKLMRQPWLRLAMVVGLPLLAPVFLIYRINRYDSCGMLGLALAAVALTVRNRPGRMVLLAVGGFLIGTSGFPVIIGGGVLTILAWWLLGRRAIPDFLAVNAGIAGGLCSVLVHIVTCGQLDVVRAGLALDGVNVRRTVVWHLLSPIRGGQLSKILDEDLLLVVAAAVAVIASLLGQSGRRLRTAGVFGLAAATIVPLALSGLGRYSATYVWMATIPLYISCMIVLDHELKSRICAALIVILLVGSTLVGFPAHAMMLAAEWVPQDRHATEAWIDAHIKPDDVVYASIVGYYPAKERARTAYIGPAFHSLTKEQKSTITLLVMDGYENGRALKEPTAEEAMAALGGRWSAVAELRTPRGELRKRIPPKPRSDCTYHVTIYRRQVR